MTIDAAEDVTTVPIDDFNSNTSEAGSSKVPTIECLSFNGEVTGDSRNDSEVLTRIELELACSSEKLVNLHILMMNVANMESDFESLASGNENLPDPFVDKALEFDLLSGILDSELTELDSTMDTLETEISNARETLSSFDNLTETYVQVEEKLHDSEKSLQQSQEQLSEMKIQSAKFQSALSSFGKGGHWSNDKDGSSIDSSKMFDTNGKINMQTVEQQRHILRMLEKSLAREMDLEKKLSESRQTEDELRVRLYTSEQEVFNIEEDTTDVLEQFLEADNANTVLMGISKELLGNTQIFQSNSNILMKREAELKTKVDLLENELKKSDIRLQHELACAEATLEKINMLNSTIQDMENLIEDLKSKVLKAETRADSVEDKCIILSENNEELNEELCFLRNKIECLEASRHEVEDTKATTARDIGIRTKLIANLVTQLAIERKRLHMQISSLVAENKIMAVKLKQTNQASSLTTRLGSKGDNKEVLLPKDEITTATSGEQDITEELIESSVTSLEVNKTKNASPDLGEPADLITEELETVRRIDAWVLNWKHVFAAVLVLLISAAGYKFQQHNTSL